MQEKIQGTPTKVRKNNNNQTQKKVKKGNAVELGSAIKKLDYFNLPSQNNLYIIAIQK